MNDDEILAAIAAAVNDDLAGPPPDAVEAAYAAFGWRSIDAELARLVEDEQPEVALFDHGPPARTVTFEAGEGTIRLGIDHDEIEIVVDPAPMALHLQRPDGVSIEVGLDEQGRGGVRAVSGPLRFTATWAGGATVTPWITL